MSSQPGHILVVDDNEVNRLKLSMGLTKQGYQVAQAENGRQALDMLRTAPFDLVLLDIMMPVMDGHQTLREMKQDAALRDIPVIIISALEEMESMIQGIELGAEDYLPKTFDPVLLKARIGASLEKKRLRDNEQLYLKGLERELEIGRQIQAGFLPKTLPQLNGLEIAARLQPARQVAGDFYDAFLTAEGYRVGLVVGDVCNKGVGAALFMTLFRSLIRATANQKIFTRGEHISPAGKSEARDPEAASPDDELILKHTVHLTNDYIAQTHSRDTMFSTLFFGLIDPVTGRLTYINGGNEPPVIINGQGLKKELTPTGPVVGLWPGYEFKTEQTVLSPGDTLLAFTDGVTDALNEADEQFSHDRLMGVVTRPTASASHLLDRVEAALEAFTAGVAQYDDITMLAVHRAQ